MGIPETTFLSGCQNWLLVASQWLQLLFSHCKMLLLALLPIWMVGGKGSLHLVEPMCPQEEDNIRTHDSNSGRDQLQNYIPKYPFPIWRAIKKSQAVRASASLDAPAL